MTEQNQQNSLLGKIAAYTEILAKDPGSTIFVSLSEAYRKIGMLNDARQVIETGLGGHPDFSPAHIVYARILCQQGEYDASSAAFQRALSLDSESLAALVGYARLHILLGQESQARALLLNARDLSPADPVINKLLLSLPDVEPEPEPVLEQDIAPDTERDAAEQPSEPLEVTDSDSGDEEWEGGAAPPLASSTLADLYLKQGLTDQAHEMYRQLLAEDPDNLEYRRKIRDLEGGQEAIDTGADSVNSQDQLVGVEPPEVAENTANGTEVALASDLIVESPEPSAEKRSDEKVLQTLNRWLDSIKKRREDV